MPTGKLNYTILIELLPETEGGWYVAVAPDLAGCITGGATPEEALANIKTAIADWIEAARKEGLPIPPPRRVMEKAPPRVWVPTDK
jgi:antitoxin HicB